MLGSKGVRAKGNGQSDPAGFSRHVFVQTYPLSLCFTSESSDGPTYSHHHGLEQQDDDCTRRTCQTTS
jgi:hypothetical protein